jgi:hypothetical protein
MLNYFGVVIDGMACSLIISTMKPTCPRHESGDSSFDLLNDKFLFYFSGLEIDGWVGIIDFHQDQRMIHYLDVEPSRDVSKMTV